MKDHIIGKLFDVVFSCFLIEYRKPYRMSGKFRSRECRGYGRCNGFECLRVGKQNRTNGCAVCGIRKGDRGVLRGGSDLCDKQSAACVVHARDNDRTGRSVHRMRRDAYGVAALFGRVECDGSDALYCVNIVLFGQQMRAQRVETRVVGCSEQFSKDAAYEVRAVVGGMDTVVVDGGTFGGGHRAVAFQGDRFEVDDGGIYAALRRSLRHADDDVGIGFDIIAVFVGFVAAGRTDVHRNAACGADLLCEADVVVSGLLEGDGFGVLRIAVDAP